MKAIFLLLSLFLAVPVMAADELQPAPIQQPDILPYLEQSIGWLRAVEETELLAHNAREMLLKDKIRLSANQAVQKSFDFARAQAAILPAETTEVSVSFNQAESRRERLTKASNEVNARINNLQSALKAPALPLAKREKLQGDLKLAKAQQELLQTLMRIFNAEGDKAGTLIDQINAISRSVVEDLPQEKPAASKEGAATQTVVTKENTLQDDDGMFRLSGKVFSLSRKQTEVRNLIKQTEALTEANRAMINSVRASLRQAIADGNALTTDTASAKDLNAYHHSLDELITRYKQLSAAIIPLGQMNVVLDTIDRNLKEWDRLVTDDWKRALRQLLIRLLVLSVAIAIPFILSELARRATKRYVHAAKRRKQLRVARRILLVLTLTFVVLANFITEFGSLATFAGFITAGLAVALQTVLVSLVAHFFFFGRYGVRAGDRITVSGVTGDVLQIGMLRIYIRELEQGENGMVPTGKMVAFPNSILFQPTAFYKHVES